MVSVVCRQGAVAAHKRRHSRVSHGPRLPDQEETDRDGQNPHDVPRDTYGEVYSRSSGPNNGGEAEPRGAPKYKNCGDSHKVGSSEGERATAACGPGGAQSVSG